MSERDGQLLSDARIHFCIDAQATPSGALAKVALELESDTFGPILDCNARPSGKKGNYGNNLLALCILAQRVLSDGARLREVLCKGAYVPAVLQEHDPEYGTRFDQLVLWFYRYHGGDTGSAGKRYAYVPARLIAAVRALFRRHVAKIGGRRIHFIEAPPAALVDGRFRFSLFAPSHPAILKPAEQITAADLANAEQLDASRLKALLDALYPPATESKQMRPYCARQAARRAADEVNARFARLLQRQPRGSSMAMVQQLRKLVDSSLSDAGYILVTGDDGFGKSTLLAHLVEDLKLSLFHFCCASSGLGTRRQFTQAMCARMLTLLGRPNRDLPWGFDHDAELFSNLLRKVAAEHRGEALVVAIDSVDEVRADPEERACNVLLLPALLPRRTCVVLSARSPSACRIDGPVLREYRVDKDNSALQRVFEEQARRGCDDPTVAQWLRRRGLDVDSLIERCWSASSGSLLYLTSMLSELARGGLTEENWDHLPNGWNEYLKRRFEGLEAGLGRRYGRTVLPILCTLAAAQVPLTADVIATWSEAPADEVAVILRDHCDWLVEGHGTDNARRYQLAHVAYRRFLASTHAGIVRRQHARVAETLLDVHDDPRDGGRATGSIDYPVAHLVSHVTEAARPMLADRAAKRVCDFSFLTKRAVAGDRDDLGALCDLLPPGEGRTALRRALSEWALVEDVDCGQLASGLIGRLQWCNEAFIRRVIAGADEYGYGVWLRPKMASLSHAVARMRMMAPHDAAVTAVCMDSAGSAYVSGDSNGRVVHGDLQCGVVLRSLHAHTARVTRVVLARDDQSVTSGGADGQVVVWQPYGVGRAKRTLSVDGQVHGMVVSDDAGLIVVGTTRHQVCVFRRTNRDYTLLTIPFEQHSEAWRTAPVGLSGSHVWLHSYGRRGNVLVEFDLESRTVVSTRCGYTHDDPVLAINRSEGVLVSGRADHTLEVFELDRKKPRGVLEGHGRRTTLVAISDDSRWAVSGTGDTTLKLWDLQQTECAGHIRAGAPVESACLSQDGATCVTGDTDGALQVWDLDMVRGMRPCPGHDGRLTTMARFGDGDVVTGGTDGQLLVWDWERCEVTEKVAPGESAITAVGSGLPAELVACGYQDGTLRLWARAVGQVGNSGPLQELELGRWSTEEGPIKQVRIGAQGSVIVAVSNDQVVAVWRLGSKGIEDHWRPNHVGCATAIAIDDDANALLIGDDQGFVDTWDLNAHRSRGRVWRCASAISAIALTNGGTRAAASCADGSIVLYDLSGCESDVTLRGSGRRVTDVALSKHANLLASTSIDGTLRLWSTSEQRVLASFSDTAPLRACVFSHDDHFIGTGGDSGQMHFLELRGL